MTDYTRQLDIIAGCSDRTKLRNWIRNAERSGAMEVVETARRRLIAVEALAHAGDAADPLTVDFWKSIVALELMLSMERGKTTLLSRTRQKILRVGVERTVADLALQPVPSEGYRLLQDRKLLDLSAEAVILSHAERFDGTVVAAAQDRLVADRTGPV